jgi:hypothetical protein
MTPAKLLVLDPLTLIGREFLQRIEAVPGMAGHVDFRHTAADEEHEIAEIGGDPALVPPLDDPTDLEGFDAVVVTSDAQSSRHDHVLAFAEANPDAALVDVSRLDCLRERTIVSMGDTDPALRHLRVAHPALVAVVRVVEVMAHYGRPGGTLAVTDPVSVHGKDGVELLALQATRRLQGTPVNDLIYGHVRAFNTLAVDAFDLQDEAAHLLPGLPLAVTRCLAGVFHGNLAHLGLDFADALEPGMVRDALQQAEGLELADFPLGLDTVVDNDRVLVAPFALSADGRHLAVTMMADGLRLAANTAVDILEGLI